jgi:hypothetical protein
MLERTPETAVNDDGAPAPSARMRRLREDPLAVVEHLAETVGARLPTSVPEAKAAAYLDGRLRRAGMQVALDTFRTPVPPGFDSAIVAVLALTAVILYYWFPLPAIMLAVVHLGFAATTAWRTAPLAARRHISQNVIATRAAIEAPRARVVLLAALDTHPGYPRWLAPICGGSRLRAVRLMCAALLVSLMVAGIADAQPLWWYLQVPFVVALLLLAIAEWFAWRTGSAGAASDAGAAAAALVAAATLGGLNRAELWVVGLGAMSVGAGLADLLRRYPFDSDTTLFLALDGMGRGAPAALAADGWPERASDAELRAMAEQAGVAVAARRRGPGGRMAQQLRVAGKRAITITCLDAAGRTPLFATAADVVESIDGEALERAAEAVMRLVRCIDDSRR